MTSAVLPKNCAIDGLAGQLAGAGALSTDWKSVVLTIPEHSFIQCSALAFLCAWGRQQRSRGHELLIRGDEAALSRLVRLDLQEHLGLAYRKVAALADVNPFVPLRL